MRLSNQAVGALMLALQVGIMEQKDITEMLKDFELEETPDGLVVKNPPIVNIEDQEMLEMFDDSEDDGA